jgi:hypothetical protein
LSNLKGEVNVAPDTQHGDDRVQCYGINPC